MDLESLKIDRSVTRRPRRGSIIPRLLGLGIVALLVGVVYLFWAPLQRTLDRVRLPKVRVVRVERAHPAELGAVRGMAANGYIVAARRAALSADTPGRIVEMNAEEGTVVKAGQVVARLFADEYAAALRRAEAELGAAEAAAQRAAAEVVSAEAEVRRAESAAAAARSAMESDRSTLALARQEQARVDRLIKGGVATTREQDQAEANLSLAQASLRRTEALEAAANTAVDTARTRVQVAKADVTVARARVGVAQAACDQARATLDKTEVRAPFDGVVVLKDAEVGEVVSVQGGNNTRGSVVTMVDLASLEVQADVPETSLAAVRQDGPCQVFLDAYPGKAYPARVARIWPTANRQKATVEVRVRFAQLDPLLRPEMGVRVVFAPEDAESEAPVAAAEGPRPLLVPEEAVVKVAGAEGVFGLERDAVSFRVLRLGERRAGMIEVLEGLEEGERIVLDPPPTLESGHRVQTQES